MKNNKMGISYWVLIIIGILLNLSILVGQTGALIDYDFTVSIGMQESIEEVTDVGVAWQRGLPLEIQLFICRYLLLESPGC